MNLHELARLIRDEREPLLRSWREQVRELPSGKHLDVPTLNDHVPQLLEELAVAFESVSDQTIPEALLESSPAIHGIQRQEIGFDIVEVVAEYNILRGCIHDLTENHELHLRGRPFHILNRVLDQAIRVAVQTFTTQCALDVQKRREEYLAFVAHDLRTPLNAISLAATVLERGAGGDSRTEEIAFILRTLHRNVQRLAELVENILKENAHVQTESGVKLERRRFDLWPLVEALIHDLRPIAGIAGPQLVNAVPEELTIFADASLLRRIFQNLVANAIKYTPGGEILIGAREALSDGCVECWVIDNGAGIPEDRIDLVFDKLETDPETEDGTGLGLAIVKSFVEAHGGQVTVESKEGVGSAFRFTVPSAV